MNVVELHLDGNFDFLNSQLVEIDSGLYHNAVDASTETGHHTCPAKWKNDACSFKHINKIKTAFDYRLVYNAKT